MIVKITERRAADGITYCVEYSSGFCRKYYEKQKQYLNLWPYTIINGRFAVMEKRLSIHGGKNNGRRIKIHFKINESENPTCGRTIRR